MAHGEEQEGTATAAIGPVDEVAPEHDTRLWSRRAADPEYMEWFNQQSPEDQQRIRRNDRERADAWVEETEAPYARRQPEDTTGEDIEGFIADLDERFTGEQPQAEYEEYLARQRERGALARGRDEFAKSADYFAGIHRPGAEEFAGRPELAGAAADPAAMAAQQDALSALQDIYQQGGMTAADFARQQEAQRSTSQYMRGQREAALQQAQMSGMGGGAGQLASALSAQQGGAQAQSSADAQMLVEAQNRALQAMGATGQLASGIRGQSFGEDITRRSALDERNRYNIDWRRETGREGARRTGEARRYGAEQRARGAEQEAGTFQREVEHKFGQAQAGRAEHGATKRSILDIF